MVDSYANTKVRRSYSQKDLVVDSIVEPTLPHSEAPTSPVGAGLSASRIRLVGEGKEGQA